MSPLIELSDMNPPNTPVDSISSPISKSVPSITPRRTSSSASTNFANVFTAFSVKKLVPAIFRKTSSQVLNEEVKDQAEESSIEKSDLGKSLNLDDFSPALIALQQEQTFDLEEDIVTAEIKRMSREDSRVSSAGPELSLKSSVDSTDIPQSTRVEASSSVTIDLQLYNDPGTTFDQLCNNEGSSEAKIPSSHALDARTLETQHSLYRTIGGENDSFYHMADPTNADTPPNTEINETHPPSRTDDQSEVEKEPDYNYFKDLSVSSSFLSPIDTTTVQAIPIESSSYDMNFINYTSNTVSLSISSERPSFIRTEPSSRSPGNEDVESEVFAVLNQIIQKVVEAIKLEPQTSHSITLEELPAKKDASKESLHVKFYVDQNDESLGDSSTKPGELTREKTSPKYHTHFWKFISFATLVGFAIFSVFIDQTYDRILLKGSGQNSLFSFRAQKPFPHPIPDAHIYHEERSKFMVSEVFRINETDLNVEGISQQPLQPPLLPKVRLQDTLSSTSANHSIINNIGKKIQKNCRRIKQLFIQISSYIRLRFCQVPFIGKVCS